MKTITIDGVDYDLVPRKKEEVPPPGIISFKNFGGGYTNEFTLDQVNRNLRESCFGRAEEMTYETWAQHNIDRKDCKIHSIGASGNIWTVGDETTFGKIDHFLYEFGSWRFSTPDKTGCTLRHISQAVRPVPKPKPVVTLQGGELFEGDKYWYVDGYWCTRELAVGEYCGGCDPLKMFPKQCFPSLELVEAFVRGNKPVIPWGELEKAWWGMGDEKTVDNVKRILEKYKP